MSRKIRQRNNNDGSGLAAFLDAKPGLKGFSVRIPSKLLDDLNRCLKTINVSKAEFLRASIRRLLEEYSE